MRLRVLATRGGEAGDAEPAASSRAITRALVEERLATVFGAPPPRSAPTMLRSAAVGIVVCEHEDEPGFLLTMRSAGLSRHANQYALPGGRLDLEESHEGAVLRELEEELGLRLGDDAIVGRLPDYDTRSGFRLRPIVLWASDLGELRPAPGEVAEVFHVPLAALVDRAVPILRHVDGFEKPLIQLPLGDELIHAPTGAILYQFGEAALAGRFVDASQFEEPMFAWR